MHDNIHDAFQDIFMKLECCVNRHAQVKILKMIIKLRDKVDARKKQQSNNANCKRLYNLLRNKVHRELKKSKKQYYADYFVDNVNNIKKLGKASGKIVNISKVPTKISQLSLGGKFIEDDKELATDFNNFFVNVGPN